MNLKKMVGSRVILTIRNKDLQDKEIIPRLKLIKQRNSFSIIAKVVDYDTLGIWIERPNYPVYDEKAKERKKLLAHLLIKYEYIVSVAAFPELAQDGLKEEHSIGFDMGEDN
ncbi:MAG: hypothetical protein ACLFSQ_10275 [Candidatus Zixiibacteriota bacterium]